MNPPIPFAVRPSQCPDQQTQSELEIQPGEKGPEAYREQWQTITAGKEWRGEFHNKKKNGELYWESASLSPIRDLAGRVTHYLAVKGTPRPLSPMVSARIASTSITRTSQCRAARPDENCEAQAAPSPSCRRR